jgi:hypothetical protein
MDKKNAQMAVLKGLAQGFIVNTPRDADVFASRLCSIGTAQSVEPLSLQ